MPFDPNRLMAENLRAWSAMQRLAFRNWEAAHQWSQLVLRAGQRWPQTDASAVDATDFAGEALDILTRWQRGVGEIVAEQASAMQAVFNELAALRPPLLPMIPMPGAATAAPAP